MRAYELDQSSCGRQASQPLHRGPCGHLQVNLDLQHLNIRMFATSYEVIVAFCSRLALLSTSACFLQGARRVQMPSRWMCTGARGGRCNGARDTT